MKPAEKAMRYARQHPQEVMLASPSCATLVLDLLDVMAILSTSWADSSIDRPRALCASVTMSEAVASSIPPAAARFSTFGSASIGKIISDKSAADAEWREERQTDKETASALRDASVTQIIEDPEKFARYLTMQGDNPSYSAGNVALAMAQLPEASSEEIPLCSVPALRGEDSTRSIPSSSPHRNRCAGLRRGPKNSFNETQGRELRTPQLRDDTETMDAALTALLNFSPVQVMADENLAAGAYYDPQKMSLAINPSIRTVTNMAQAQKASIRQKRGGRGLPPEFVQDFIPLKEIKNGIIETTDGRFLKILEIEPINFFLRSSEEQWGIISSFASWLKISPTRLQFKSVTRKADSDQYVADLEADLEKEEVPACRELGRGTIRFIREEGNREALTRRFFLIFQYEAPSGRRQMDPDYGEMYAALQTAAQNARTYFAQCGNTIVQPKDEDAFLADVLYMFFNRRSCVDDPFQNRLNRVVVDAMTAKKRVVGVDPVPQIRSSNFVVPRGIDLTHAAYTVMDGAYYTSLHIRKDGYPRNVRGGWMSSLINAGEGVDVDLYLHREIRGKTIDRVAQRIRLNRTKLRELQDTATDYEELAGSIQAGYYIKQGLSSYNEDLFYMSVIITISAATYDELIWRKQQMVDMMKSMDIQTGDCTFQQEAALRSVMPFLKLDPGLERKAKRNVLTSGAASTYMFTSFELSDDNGILLGLNRHNNSLCIVDPFNTKVNKNASLTICGTSGAGKTYTIQTMALRLRTRGVQCFILAPLKGHEFKRACHKVGGTYIKLSPGSSACINVMEIRPTISPDMSNEEEQMLDEALVKTYAQFGITHDNDSLYTDESRTVMKPILYVDQDDSRSRSERNLPAVYQMLTQTSEKQLGALFDRLPVSHPAKAPTTSSTRPATMCGQASSWGWAPGFRFSKVRPSGRSPSTPTLTWRNRERANASITLRRGVRFAL